MSVIDALQDAVPGNSDAGVAAAEKEEEEEEEDTVTAYNRHEWLKRVRNKRANPEVFWDYNTFDTHTIPLTTTFILNIGAEMRTEKIFSNVHEWVKGLVNYVSIDERTANATTNTLFVRCDELAGAIINVLTGIGNKFDAKQLVLGFGETYDENLVDGEQRVPLENVLKKAAGSSGIQPQFKKRRVWRGNTQREVTPKQQHADIQNIFCVAVAKRMALNDYEDQKRQARSGADRNSIQNTITKTQTEYAYLLSRIRNASWVQLSPTLGFLTETPSLYDGAKSFAVGQLSYEKKEAETFKGFKKRYERILNNYRKKRQRRGLRGMNRTLTIPMTPHRTNRPDAADRLKREGRTGRIPLNYQ